LYKTVSVDTPDN